MGGAGWECVVLCRELFLHVCSGGSWLCQLGSLREYSYAPGHNSRKLTRLGATVALPNLLSSPHSRISHPHSYRHSPLASISKPSLPESNKPPASPAISASHPSPQSRLHALHRPVPIAVFLRSAHRSLCNLGRRYRSTAIGPA